MGDRVFSRQLSRDTSLRPPVMSEFGAQNMPLELAAFPGMGWTAFGLCCMYRGPKCFDAGSADRV